MRVVFVALHSKYIHSCLALSCLAAYCRDLSGCEMEIQEYTVHEPRDSILAAILAAGPDVVAFSVYIWNRQVILELVDALAVVAPKLVIVLGGPEISFDGPELFESHRGVSGVVRGEGEATFREVLLRLAGKKDPAGTPGTLWNRYPDFVEGPKRPSLENLDSIPSPFEAGLVDLGRGLVYLETSRGCPYRCLFCMSALDESVRSFSMDRVFRDLDFLMGRKVPKVKIVDRTFNYDPERARQIFAYLLKHNRQCHFHFEVGACLLDDETIRLLAKVPARMFQFEIGVQSCTPGTLKAVQRHMPLDESLEKIARLRAETNVSLHLDLVAGLPGENYVDFLASVDRTARLHPHHLQIELVKLLPGSILRKKACQAGIEYDPHPPYTVLRTRELSFADLARLKGVSRIVDMIFNTGRFEGFLGGMTKVVGSFASAFEEIEAFWAKRDLFRYPLQRRDVFENLWLFIRSRFSGDDAAFLTELLARDFARSERVVLSRAPDFFNTDFSPSATEAVREVVAREVNIVKGKGVKVQYFAAVFRRLPDLKGPNVLVFLYLTGRGRKLEVKEVALPGRSSYRE